MASRAYGGRWLLQAAARVGIYRQGDGALAALQDCCWQVCAIIDGSRQERQPALYVPASTRFLPPARLRCYPILGPALGNVDLDGRFPRSLTNR